MPRKGNKFGGHSKKIESLVNILGLMNSDNVIDRRGHMANIIELVELIHSQKARAESIQRQLKEEEDIQVKLNKQFIETRRRDTQERDSILYKVRRLDDGRIKLDQIIKQEESMIKKIIDDIKLERDSLRASGVDTASGNMSSDPSHFAPWHKEIDRIIKNRDKHLQELDKLKKILNSDLENLRKKRELIEERDSDYKLFKKDVTSHWQRGRELAKFKEEIKKNERKLWDLRLFAI